MLDDDEDVIFAGGPASLTAEDVPIGTTAERGAEPTGCSSPECHNDWMHEVDGDRYCWSCYRRLR